LVIGDFAERKQSRPEHLDVGWAEDRTLPLAHQLLQRRMKSHRRAWLRIALDSLRNRFKPNPLVNAPAIDIEAARDMGRRPALAKEFMYKGKQSLQPF
jgi:hypothetical protein